MSPFICPTCRRTFDESGFCPFDRGELVSLAVDRQGFAPLPAQPVGLPPDGQTLLSAAMPVVQPIRTDAPHRTDIDPKRTFPLTPTPAVSTQEVTSARTRPGPISSHPPPVIRALSASENPQAALEAYRVKHENEYDRLVGQTLDGRYYVERKIGEGGMGVVFSARHAVIERPLAIKVLKREVMRDTATIRRFVQEAKAASRIGHPNIVDVTDFGTTPDGMTYSVMEFVMGQTLGTAIREGSPMPPVRALKITSQIARALGAAHDKGIVHRDLKPENVFLVDRDGRVDFVKIVDFGIAKVMPIEGMPKSNEPRLTRAGSVFGTPEYMAPEQAAGRSDTDGRVDIYALGVILYEMLLARVPHRGDSMVRTLAMQMLDPVEPPSRARPDLGISPELEALMMKTLAKKREHRFQTMGELQAAIEQLQTPIGQSLTGSPVYALAPLPPGADAIVTAAHPATAADSIPIHAAIPHTGPGVIDPPRAKSSTRRLKDEPEFVTRDKPATFEHVFTDELPSHRGPRWPLLVFGAMIIGGAAGAIMLFVKSCNVVAPVAHDAGRIVAVPSDGPDRIAIIEADAAAEVPVVMDAAEISDDAGRTAIIVRPPGVRDAGAVAIVPATPNGRGTYSIQVITKPEGANLYVGTSYRGPGGTNLEERFGNRVDVQCRLRGYKPGNVSLVFDGKTEYVLCVLERIKICIDNIKNPFDDCVVDPNKPPGP
ncbi:MAG: protein kinase [Kofleriaceae bacterium]